MGEALKILTPTNFSIRAASALNYSAFLAKKLSATILLAHILPASAALKRSGPTSNKGAATLLEQSAAYWRSKGYRTETLLLNGSPASQIAGIAEGCGCRFIVMGFSARRRIKHCLLGSLAERVIRLSSVPIIVVKEIQEKEQARPEAAWEKEDALEGGIAGAVLGTIDINQLKH